MSYLFLVKPSIVYKEQYIEMIREWKTTNEEMIPWVLKLSYSNFEEMIAYLTSLNEGINLLSGQVSCSTFWLIRNDGKVIGVTNIRHKLNKHLIEHGGHIGYGIRPSERKKGYGTIILKLSVIQAKKLGILKIRITCDDNNIASEKIILKNNGVFDSKVVDNKKIVKRFWINI